jgi:hypothetical protein
MSESDAGSTSQESVPGEEEEPQVAGKRRDSSECPSALALERIEGLLKKAAGHPLEMVRKRAFLNLRMKAKLGIVSGTALKELASGMGPEASAAEQVVAELLVGLAEAPYVPLPRSSLVRREEVQHPDLSRRDAGVDADPRKGTLLEYAPVGCTLAATGLVDLNHLHCISPSSLGAVLCGGWCFPGVVLSGSDLCALEKHEARLSASILGSSVALCVCLRELRHNFLESFPPELFLQRPHTLRTLLSLVRSRWRTAEGREAYVGLALLVRKLLLAWSDACDPSMRPYKRSIASPSGFNGEGEVHMSFRGGLAAIVYSLCSVLSPASPAEKVDVLGLFFDVLPHIWEADEPGLNRLRLEQYLACLGAVCSTFSLDPDEAGSASAEATLPVIAFNLRLLLSAFKKGFLSMDEPHRKAASPVPQAVLKLLEQVYCHEILQSAVGVSGVDLASLTNAFIPGVAEEVALAHDIVLIVENALLGEGWPEKFSGRTSDVLYFLQCVPHERLVQLIVGTFVSVHDGADSEHWQFIVLELLVRCGATTRSVALKALLACLTLSDREDSAKCTSEPVAAIAVGGSEPLLAELLTICYTEEVDSSDFATARNIVVRILAQCHSDQGSSDRNPMRHCICWDMLSALKADLGQSDVVDYSPWQHPLVLLRGLFHRSLVVRSRCTAMVQVLVARNERFGCSFSWPDDGKDFCLDDIPSCHSSFHPLTRTLAEDLLGLLGTGNCGERRVAANELLRLAVSPDKLGDIAQTAVRLALDGIDSEMLDAASGLRLIWKLICCMPAAADYLTHDNGGANLIQLLGWLGVDECSAIRFRIRDILLWLSFRPRAWGLSRVSLESRAALEAAVYLPQRLEEIYNVSFCSGDAPSILRLSSPSFTAGDALGDGVRVSVIELWNGNPISESKSTPPFQWLDPTRAARRIRGELSTARTHSSFLDAIARGQGWLVGGQASFSQAFFCETWQTHFQNVLDSPPVTIRDYEVHGAAMSFLANAPIANIFGQVAPNLFSKGVPPSFAVVLQCQGVSWAESRARSSVLRLLLATSNCAPGMCEPHPCSHMLHDPGLMLSLLGILGGVDENSSSSSLEWACTVQLVTRLVTFISSSGYDSGSSSPTLALKSALERINCAYRPSLSFTGKYQLYWSLLCSRRCISMMGQRACLMISDDLICSIIRHTCDRVERIRCAAWGILSDMASSSKAYLGVIAAKLDLQDTCLRISTVEPAAVIASASGLLAKVVALTDVSFTKEALEVLAHRAQSLLKSGAPATLANAASSLLYIITKSLADTGSHPCTVLEATGVISACAGTLATGSDAPLHGGEGEHTSLLVRLHASCLLRTALACPCGCVTAKSIMSCCPNFNVGRLMDSRRVWRHQSLPRGSSSTTLRLLDASLCYVVAPLLMLHEEQSCELRCTAVVPRSSDLKEVCNIGASCQVLCSFCFSYLTYCSPMLLFLPSDVEHGRRAGAARQRFRAPSCFPTGQRSFGAYRCDRRRLTNLASFAFSQQHRFG